jgi:hypothetical protein
MDYLGLFCLGAFVGAIATVGLGLIKSVTDWKQVLVVILPAVLSGAAMVFVDKFKYSPALGCYPLGLVAALMWAYIGAGVENLKAPERSRKLIGFAHIAASALITLSAAIVATIPAVLQIRAEMEVSMDARVRDLVDSRQRANAPRPAASGSAVSAESPASAPSAPASEASAPKKP